MKEYQAIVTEAGHLAKIANEKAQEDWRVVSVIADRYVTLRNGELKLADVVIILECDRS